jgi:exportin-7
MTSTTAAPAASAAAASSLATIEALAEKLYSSPDQATRASAEAALKIAAPSAETLLQCRFILDASASPYALFLATSSLTKLFTDNWLAFTPQQRLDSSECEIIVHPPESVQFSSAQLLTHSFQPESEVVRFLASRGDKVPQFVLLSAMQLVARVTKLGWFDDGQASVCEDLRAFLDVSPTHRTIGLLAYVYIVQEMSVLQTGVRITNAQHNRTAQKFRDSSLLAIFSISLAALRDSLAATTPQQ